MLGIKLDLQTIGLIQHFEKITRAKVKDCFVDKLELLTFVVQPGQLRNAVGKQGFNVKRLEQHLNRKLKIIEFNPTLERFVRNVLFPSKVEEVTKEENIITVKPLDSKTRGLIIGRNAQNLRNSEATIKRYFQIEELKVTS